MNIPEKGLAIPSLARTSRHHMKHVPYTIQYVALQNDIVRRRQEDTDLRIHSNNYTNNSNNSNT
jgi:hypothetical protein